MLCVEETILRRPQAAHEDGLGEAINWFSLVNYLPNPTAAFLDQLRLELVPSCIPHAHVTILPPRQILVDSGTAWRELRERFRNFRPFNVELRNVEVFESSCVIFISLGEGWDELQDMHAYFNQGHTWFAEPYPYHPHVTLAQQITPAQVQEVYSEACKAWARYDGPRRFTVDRAVFVQATNKGYWRDLAEERLGF